MDSGMVTGLVCGGIGFLGLVWSIATYNRLVQLRNTVRESWADVDTELRRRYDLIPNLVEVVKAHAGHERGVLEAVTRAREAAIAARSEPAAQAPAENQLTRALRPLLALAESYPELRAGESFLRLQRELANTEDRIQAARRFYNGNVRERNNMMQCFPSSIIAGMFHFGEAEYFRIDDPAVAGPVRASLE